MIHNPESILFAWAQDEEEGASGFIDDINNEFKLIELTNSLTERLRDYNGVLIELPIVVYDEGLSFSYGQYANDTIRIGTALFEDEFTYDEMISIIYHEYVHYLNDKKNLYPLHRTEDGHIIQWDTDETFTISPTEEEVEALLSEILPYIVTDSMSEEEVLNITDSQRALLSTPVELPFRYAPSNLALDEIATYKEQLAGEEKGLYVLTEKYKLELERRIVDYEIVYQRRLDYEERFGLNPDGTKKQ